MRKVLAIIRREYLMGVRGKAFIVSTLIAPAFMLVMFALPQLLIGLKTGDATRVAVLDETGRLYEPLREALLRGDEEEDEAARARRESRALAEAGGGERRVPGDDPSVQTHFEVERVEAAGRTPEEVRKELSRRVLDEKLDMYLVLPADLFERGEVTLNARNTGDLFTRAVLQNRVSRTVIEQRLRDAQIDRERVRELSREVRVETKKVTEAGEKRDEGGSFFFAIGVGSFILIAMLMYGQAILSAVVEEKTTRIVEVLFSSVDAFKLLAGKLTGVALVAATQFGIWALMVAAVALYGSGVTGLGGGGGLSVPSVPPVAFLYALLYFMLGFFIYSTIYAVIGSIVTTEKEASQIVVPISFLPVVAIYLAFPVIRSPNSDFSFWVSMVPFFSPVTMLVRVATETPPFWQVALSLLVGFSTVALMIWVAARIYRTGMLMYGKRATLPEIWRWARRA